jgi:hypothetical protein
MTATSYPPMASHPGRPGHDCRHSSPACPAHLARSRWSPHGGITTDLLRSLLKDHALAPQLLAAGIPPCAITAIDDLTVVTIASTAHLS